MIPRKILIEKFGISRKVLDHYNKLGLLCPLNIDEIKTGKQIGLKPEWKYDDDAYFILQYIEVLRFIGFKPSRIKELFEESDSILDDIMTELIKKKKNIDKMITIVKLLQITSNIPESAKTALKNYDFKYLVNEQKYSDMLKVFGNIIPESNNETDIEEMETDYQITSLILSIIGFQDKEPESDDVQAILWESYSIYVKQIFEGSEFEENLDILMGYSDFINAFVKRMENDFLKENMDDLKSLYGDKSIKFVLAALKYFQVKHDGKYIREI